MSRTLWLILAVVAAFAFGLARADVSTGEPATVAAADASVLFARVPATEPKNVAATFHALHGFRMELLAAEPLVTDPVALEYDESGLAWVVEMRDYPYTDKSTDKPNVERTTDAPLGRIRVLEDVDGDGRFDKSAIFAEDLSWPTGLALWKGGCFVTATPDVWYLKDTDGDRRADVRRKVFTGFRKLNVQAVINNLRWGLDHKLYAAGASNGGTITKPDEPQAKPITLGRADFAFDPNTERFEVLAGGARFGQTFDDWGNRFVCNIRNPVQHVVFENRYLARNPYLPVTTAVHDCAEAGDTLPVYRASPPEPWRAARAERWRQETGQAYPRSELAGEGYFTSSSGITIYRGAAYPKEFYGNAFLGEVAGNLIHRQVLTPDGATFKTRRADENAEFVASTDNWFRPVNFTNAPDGTLHVCDMYRETIEHPWSIPDDMKPHLDLESGRDRGRIYRLEPPALTARTTKPNLGNATADELVAALENPNSWWRDTAHRLIFERQDKTCIEPLRKLLRESNTEVARAHAVWSLAGLGALSQDDWWQALFVDSSKHVACQALKAGEAAFSVESNEEWRTYLAHGAMDGFGHDRAFLFQLALSAGNNQSGRLAIVPLLRGFAADPWIVAAALSGSGERTAELLSLRAELLKGTGLTGPLYSLYDPVVTRKLAMIVGAKADQEEVVEVVQLIAAAEGPLRTKAATMLAGLAEGLKQAGRSLSQFKLPQSTQGILETFLTEAATVAVDDKRSDSERVAAWQLLAHGQFATAAAAFEASLKKQQSGPVQLEAVRTIAGLRSQGVPSLLLKNYKAYTPSVRAEVVEALASLTSRHDALLDAVESKQIAVADIPIARRALLMKAKNSAIAERAKKLLTTSTGARAATVAKYLPALKLAGDVDRGHKVFSRECKTCHKLRGEGFEIGPNLATILHRGPDELLTHILDPNREVSPNYLEYIAELDDGRTLTGLVAEETAASITLRKAENVQATVLRGNVESLYSTGKSLMPEGLEQKLTPQDAADLIAFLLARR